MPEGFPAHSHFPNAVSRHAGAQPNEEMDHSFIGMTGGEVIHEMLRRHEVKQMFGYPGGAALPIFDAIFQSKHVDFVLPR
jgi:acetolactate synthase-1/2/3 large subunit